MNRPLRLRVVVWLVCMTMLLAVIGWRLVDGGQWDFAWWTAVAVAGSLLLALPALVRDIRASRCGSG